MSEGQYLNGRLLLAMPGMGDPRFEHAVIALCMHDANGAFGIGLGEPVAGVRLHALLKDLNIDPGVAPDCEVINGGPVEPTRGFVLHSGDWRGEGTADIVPICAVSASLDVLRAIADGSGPKNWLVALGYAGWGPGQLDGEMRRHGWFAAEGRSAILFDTATPDRWSAAWQAEGIAPAHLSNVTGRA
jgi:putative transcriptional regulator